MLANREVVATIGVMGGLPSVLTAWAESFARMVAFSHEYVCGPNQTIKQIWSAHAYHSVARNNIAREAEGEFIFLADTDHAHAPDLLFRLINAANKFSTPEYEVGCVASVYLMRTPPYRPTLWRFGEDGRPSQPLVDWPKDDAFEVDCAGAGGLLVRTSVFKRIWRELGEEPFDTHQFMQNGGVVGEDFAFFRRCKKLGVRTICCPWIQCPHLQVKPLDADKDYDIDAVMAGRG